MKIQLLTLLFIASAAIFKAQNYTVSTAAGNGFAGYVDGSASNCEMNRTYGVKCVNDSLVYFADIMNHCIRKLNTGTNMVSTVAGTGVAGYQDGVGTVAKFNVPASLCYKNGFIYVTEAGGNRIRKIDLNNNNTVTTVAGTGTAGFQNGSVTSAQFNNPFGICVDNSGNIYVADYANNCIRLISNGQVTTYAGGSVSGNTNGTLANARFNLPRDIILDSITGDFYVADQNNNLIRKISGGMVSTFCGSGAQGSTDGTAAAASFFHPVGLCQTSNGYFYILDSGNNKVRKSDPSGTVSTVAGTGAAGFVDGPGASAEFNLPGGIAYEGQGKVFVGDNLNNRIRKMTVPEVVGIRSFDKDVIITISPNPASETIHLGSEKELGEVIILNSLGEKVFQNRTSENKLQINVSYLSTGFYLIMTNGGQSRFIKE